MISDPIPDDLFSTTPATEQEVVVGDSLDLLRAMRSDSIDACVTDPPAGIEFMGKAWDRFDGREANPSGPQTEEWHDNGGKNPYARRATPRYQGKNNASLLPFQDFIAEVFTEVHRVLKPGGHALVWALPRTSHHTAMGLERAGFQIGGFDVRDVIHNFVAGDDASRRFFESLSAEQLATFEQVQEALHPSIVYHTFGSGFPKSVNLGDGVGSAVKPAAEHWILARKPLDGTLASNLAKHGTGGLNIDGCRVAHASAADQASATPQGRATSKPSAAIAATPDAGRGLERVEFDRPDTSKGRWPSNVVLSHSDGCELLGARSVRANGHHPAARPAGSKISGAAEHVGQAGLAERHADGEVVESWRCVPGCPVAEIDRQSGAVGAAAASGPALRNTNTSVARNKYNGLPANRDPLFYGDRGGASRFFYVAKAARSEREAGCEHLTPKSGAEAVDREEGSAGTKSPRAGAGRTARQVRNGHPTVKPIALMRWLIRLVARPGQVVIDPFAGSGTTLCAAALEGVDCIGFEREPEYAEIARARIAHWRSRAERK